MTNQTYLLRKLASDLALAAHKLSIVHGDIAARILVYTVFLHRLSGNEKAAEIVQRFDNQASIRYLNEMLDQAGIDELPTELRTDEAAIYFFEDFFRACNPAIARKRGVHYTPPAVVSYIVRAVESMLEKYFGEKLSDAVIVDPCCGAGTFLQHVLKNYSPHPKMIGMELMPVTCAVASLILDGCRVIRTNSLEEQNIETGRRTLIVLGNPPYSGHSANNGTIRKLLVDYRDGLNERNLKWLQDDYVKFIRIAQHWVEQAERGIVAFITNHSYIFNPTFRKMRASLARTFDRIYILDLHGNAKLAEENNLDKKDENVFPIRMGVAISIMVRNAGDKSCKIRYADIRGTRNEKLDILSHATIYTTPWREISPVPPFNLFIPSRINLESEYSHFASLFDIFQQFSVGFVTSRDGFALDFDKQSLLDRIAEVRDEQVPIEQIRKRYPIGDLDIEAFRRELTEDATWQDKAISVLYRPFDRRWVYYSRTLMERPRLQFMKNLMKPNIALAIGRAGHATGSNEWDVVFCTDMPADLNLFRRGGATLFPRYVYNVNERQSNMAPVDADPDEVFHYIYALLHSSIYRKRYADFLMTDFPRVPLIKPGRLLTDLASLGKCLMSVHLLNRDVLSSFQTLESSNKLRIGGYELPRKYIEDRRRKGLTNSDLVVVDLINKALTATKQISRQIDEILSSEQPWQSAERLLPLSS